MKDFTHDDTTATGHWGATGVAAMMDRIVMPWGDGDALAQRFGSGGNQVLSEVTSGAGYILSGLGLPKDSNGTDTTGTNLFGKDYYYIYVTNDMCLIVAVDWGDATTAGVWSARCDSRANSYYGVGFRCGCYHV